MPTRRTLVSILAGLTLGVVPLALAGCSPSPPDVTVNSTAADASGVAVTGAGEVKGTPDTLTVTLGISLKDADVSAAIAKNSEKAAALIAALKKAGVAAEDIQTRDYSIAPETRYVNNESVPDGFRVSNIVVAKVRKLDSAGGVIDAATATGGNDVVVQGVAFSLEDDSKAQEGARAQAFADAKAKAEQLAELSGRSLGRVERVNLEVQSDPVPVAFEAAADAASRATSTPIETGQVTTRVTVDVRWSFE